MHEASYEKLRAFRWAYLNGPAASATRPLRVLDVGSGASPDSLTYRSLFPPPHFAYRGLDIEPGPNVDVVVTDPYCWREVPTESVDVVVSGQMLEHSPYFWISVAEMARVLGPGGLMALVAPSAGHVHRHPYDCWRFYPDSWPALCAYVGVELVETLRERDSTRKVVPGTYWRDAMMVARKPVPAGPVARQAFLDHLAAVVATRTTAPPVHQLRRGPAADLYDRVHQLPVGQVVWRPMRLAALVRRTVSRARESRWVRAVRRRLWARDGRASLRRGEAAMPWAPVSRARASVVGATAGPPLETGAAPPAGPVPGPGAAPPAGPVVTTGTPIGPSPVDRR